MLDLDKGLYVIETTRRAGLMTGVALAKTPGWNRVQAHRYLRRLSDRGWLEQVNDKGYPRYVLGPKMLSVATDLKF